MIESILVGSLVILINTSLQAMATGYLIVLLIRRIERGSLGVHYWRNIVAMQFAILFLLAVEFIQVLVWAVVFLICQEFPDFSTACYFSLSNFTSLGYGDLVISDKWRLLGPIEGANGLLMFSITASTVFTLMTRMIESRIERDRALKRARRLEREHRTE